MAPNIGLLLLTGTSGTGAAFEAGGLVGYTFLFGDVFNLSLGLGGSFGVGSTVTGAPFTAGQLDGRVAIGFGF